MSKANLNFDNIEIKKSAFHSSNYLINIDKVNIEKKSILTRFHMVKVVLNTALITMTMIEINHCV